MRAVVLAFALVAGPAWGQVKTTNDRIVEWKQCVLSAADGWAKQKEAADVIAAGALGSCARFDDAVRKSMQADAPAFTFDEAQQMVTGMKATLSGMAIARVLKARAAKP